MHVVLSYSCNIKLSMMICSVCLLQLMIPAFYESCSGMINKWEKLVSVDEGPCELDVWPDLQGLTCDAISRTSFGSNYEEGKRIFDLLKELTDLTVHFIIKAIVIPGYR